MKERYLYYMFGYKARPVSETKKKQDKHGLSVVTTKDPVTGIEHEIHSKEGMEEAIMNANRVKYHQTENYCPFLESPLVEDFGACGDGPAMKQAMNGTYKVLSEVDQFTKDYIEVCQQNQSIIDTPCPLTRTS